MTSSAFNENTFRGLVAPICRLKGFRVPAMAGVGVGRGGRKVPRFRRSGECIQRER